MNNENEILTEEEFQRAKVDSKFFVTLSSEKQGAVYLREDIEREKIAPMRPEWEKKHRQHCCCGGGGRRGGDFPWVSAAVAAYSIFGDW